MNFAHFSLNSHCYIFFSAANRLAPEASDSTTEESDVQSNELSIQKINFQPSVSRRNANRYALSFHRETVKELKAQKEAARNPIHVVSRKELETDDVYFQGYDFPIRPEWTYEMSKEAVDRNENRYFTVSFESSDFSRILCIFQQINIKNTSQMTFRHRFTIHLIIINSALGIFMSSSIQLMFQFNHLYFNSVFFIFIVFVLGVMVITCSCLLFILTRKPLGLCHEIGKESHRAREAVELLRAEPGDVATAMARAWNIWYFAGHCRRTLSGESMSQTALNQIWRICLVNCWQLFSKLLSIV